MEALALIFILAVQPYLLTRRFHPRIALIVFGFNLTAICLTKALHPLYPMVATSKITVYLFVLNLLILSIPGKWMERSGLLSFRLGTLGKAVVLIPITLIIIIGSCEWISQQLVLLGILKTTQPIVTVREKGNHDWRMVHITSDEYRIPDPVLFWRSKFVAPITSQGFKGPVMEIPKPPGVYRIICYGDSNTEGPPKATSWPGKLQKVLNRHEEDGLRKFEVLNAGVAGYSSYQGLMRFREEVDLYEPDLIFVSFGWNDGPWTTGKADNDFQPPSPSLIAVKRTLLRYQLYRSLRYYIIQLWKSETKRTASGIHRVSIPDYVKNLAGFVETARERNIHVVLLTRPHREKAYDMVKRDTWLKYVPEYNRALLEFAEENEVLALDVQSHFENKHSDLFADACHFKQEGHKKMAELLYWAFSRFESSVPDLSSK